MQASFSLRQRATAWREVLSRPARFARRAGLVAVGVGCALLARRGTSWTRAGAAAGVLAVLLLGLLGWWLDRHAGLDPGRVVRQVIRRTDRALGEQALRLVRLMQRLTGELVSAPASANQGLTLATFQFDKLIEKTSIDRVRGAAQRRARLYRWLGAGCALVALAVGVGRMREIIEGVDVLWARGGRAPWPLFWTEQLRVQAQPPAYLRTPARRLFSGAASLLPMGTQLTLRARPLYADRQLVVTDGVHEIPFVSDGEGGLVAHYEVEQSQALTVAARFGDVLIAEPDPIQIVALQDAAPVVSLDGAPATQQLRELSRLELRWSAQDDHGLRQVDLVLRSGNREERRVLGTYDDESARQRGGHVLQPSDPFLRSLYLPAQISIEARDNDPVGGSKWGKSAVITLLPTAVGELEALRYLALTRARDGFLEAIALGSEWLPPPSGKAASKAAAAEIEQRFAARLESAAQGFEQVLGDSYGGLRVAPGLRNFALGRLRMLRAEKGSVRERSNSAGLLVLGLDGVLMSLAHRDAQRVAKILGNVAEEAMVGAQQAQSGEAPGPGLDRLAKAIYALHAGATQLLALGSLGNDLGSVALADLGRVSRASDGGDLYHAELAARHLAERLHRPLPSFGASSSGAVEAGQSESSEPQEGSSGEGQKKFDELVEQIAELAHQHAAAVEQVDQTLSGAKPPPEAGALREEAELRAKEIRRAVEGLPEPGNSPGTAEAAGALARENARGMAHELESMKLEQAADSARRALAALTEARAKSAGQSYFQGQLEAAKASVEEHLRWLQEQLEAQKKAARDRARGQLQGPSALEDELAGKARTLAQRGDDRTSPLPGEVTDRLRQADQLMQQAARELGRGEGEAGLSLQRQAQRLLEGADQGKPRDQEEGEGEQGDDGKERATGDGSGGTPFSGDVPAAEQQNRAEEFRRRVIRSLGEGPVGRLAPAVKRYAEGLLR
ncbi:MAG: DUF4175 family protein [Deltaproteobacteria bacterium]